MGICNTYFIFNFLKYDIILIVCKRSKRMSKKKIVVFDFDGTLANSLPLIGYCFEKSLANYLKEEVKEEDVFKYSGPTEKGIIKKIVKPEDFLTAFKKYLEIYNEKHDEYIKEIDVNLINLLTDLKNKKITVVLATGRGRESTIISFKRLGLNKYFDGIYTGSLVRVNKADSLKKIMKKYDVTSNDVIYIGDTYADYLEMSKVNIKLLSVLYYNMADELRLKGVNVENLVYSIKELKTKIEEFIK